MDVYMTWNNKSNWYFRSSSLHTQVKLSVADNLAKQYIASVTTDCIRVKKTTHKNANLVFILSSVSSSDFDEWQKHLFAFFPFFSSPW